MASSICPVWRHSGFGWSGSDGVLAGVSKIRFLPITHVHRKAKLDALFPHSLEWKVGISFVSVSVCPEAKLGSSHIQHQMLYLLPSTLGTDVETTGTATGASGSVRQVSQTACSVKSQNQARQRQLTISLQQRRQHDGPSRTITAKCCTVPYPSSRS